MLRPINRAFILMGLYSRSGHYGCRRLTCSSFCASSSCLIAAFLGCASDLDSVALSTSRSSSEFAAPEAEKSDEEEIEQVRYEDVEAAEEGINGGESLRFPPHGGTLPNELSFSWGLVSRLLLEDEDVHAGRTDSVWVEVVCLAV